MPFRCLPSCCLCHGPCLSPGPGVEQCLLLQEETQEYLDEAKLKELIAKYSEFINFPIYLYASKEIDEPVEDDDEPAAAADTDEVEDEEGACLVLCQLLPAELASAHRLAAQAALQVFISWDATGELTCQITACSGSFCMPQGCDMAEDTF